jgi:hypothetical protein
MAKLHQTQTAKVHPRMGDVEVRRIRRAQDRKEAAPVRERPKSKEEMSPWEDYGS